MRTRTDEEALAAWRRAARRRFLRLLPCKGRTGCPLWTLETRTPASLRHELLDGVHVVSPAPTFHHQEIAGNVYGLIWSFLRKAEHRDLGKVAIAPTDVVPTPHDVVQPDVLFVTRERLDIITKANLQGVPDLCVEVLSESTRRRDEIDKRKLYDREGAAEYWVVDPVIEAVKVYRRVGERFERVAELSLEEEDVLTTPLLPGLDLPLAEIFRS